MSSSPLLPRTALPGVLVVISEGEANVFDQRGLEQAVLKANPAIRILRSTFDDLAEAAGRTEVEEGSKRLFV